MASKMTVRADQIADAAAGTAIATWLGLSLGEWDAVIHIVAGIVAIIAGGAATWYHIRKGLEIERRRRDGEAPKS